LRLRFRSAGMCVAGWPGERPVRRPSRSNPSRLSRLRWGRCRHVSHAHSLGCPDCGRDEQVSGAGRRRAGPSLAARLAHGWGGASPCARKRRGCVLSDAVHPQPAFRLGERADARRHVPLFPPTGARHDASALRFEGCNKFRPDVLETARTGKRPLSLSPSRRIPQPDAPRLGTRSRGTTRFAYPCSVPVDCVA
jgi:hypothetical protein